MPFFESYFWRTDLVLVLIVNPIELGGQRRSGLPWKNLDRAAAARVAAFNHTFRVVFRILSTTFQVSRLAVFVCFSFFDFLCIQTFFSKHDSSDWCLFLSLYFCCFSFVDSLHGLDMKTRLLLSYLESCVTFVHNSFRYFVVARVRCHFALNLCVLFEFQCLYLSIFIYLDLLEIGIGKYFVNLGFWNLDRCFASN